MDIDMAHYDLRLKHTYPAINMTCRVESHQNTTPHNHQPTHALKINVSSTRSTANMPVSHTSYCFHVQREFPAMRSIR